MRMRLSTVGVPRTVLGEDELAQFILAKTTRNLDVELLADLLELPCGLQPDPPFHFLRCLIRRDRDDREGREAGDRKG